MSEKKSFDCPSCFEPMTFKGGESLFQNCDACMAPIIVPDDIYYGTGRVLASAGFASLQNDIEVDVEQVTNELTPGDSPPEVDALSLGEAVIEKFDVYQEKIGTGTVNEKQVFDEIVSASEGDALNVSTLHERTPHQEHSATFDLIRSELNAGDKVEAIKIFRETFGSTVGDAKDAVEALERGETLDVRSFQI